MTDTANYDFSQHDAEHYKKYEYSYGIVLLDPEHKKVVLVKTHQGFYGFPKGHKNDGEENAEAAAREVHEELGVKLDPEDFLSFWKESEQIRSFSIKYDTTIPQEWLDKHIAKQVAKGERPHWNRAGDVTRKVVFFVAELDPDVPLRVSDELDSAEWVTLEEALEKMKTSNSNHLEILQRLMQVLPEQSKQGGCPCSATGSYEVPYLAVIVMALIIAIMLILIIYVIRTVYVEACCI